MSKTFSFVGVSSAAVALAVLCPSGPAQALTFNWSFTGSGAPSNRGLYTGTIDIPGSTDGLYKSGVTATVASVPFISGSPSYGAFSVDTDPVFGAGYNGILLSGGAIDQSGYSDIRLIDGAGQTLAFRGSLQSDGITPSTYIKASFTDTSSNPPMGNTGFSNSLATFTAVPAPLPLLGLGAATAFSRKLKQRIALKRKREEVGVAV